MKNQNRNNKKGTSVKVPVTKMIYKVLIVNLFLSLIPF